MRPRGGCAHSWGRCLAPPPSFRALLPPQWLRAQHCGRQAPPQGGGWVPARVALWEAEPRPLPGRALAPPPGATRSQARSPGRRRCPGASWGLRAPPQKRPSRKAVSPPHGAPAPKGAGASRSLLGVVVPQPHCLMGFVVLCHKQLGKSTFPFCFEPNAQQIIPNR